MYACADAAIAVQNRLLAVRERSFRLHGHRRSPAMATSVICLRILELSSRFGSRELGRDVLRINGFTIILLNFEIQEVDSRILQSVCLPSIISPKCIQSIVWRIATSRRDSRLAQEEIPPSVPRFQSHT
jgi:hypothetical protein